MHVKNNERHPYDNFQYCNKHVRKDIFSGRSHLKLKNVPSILVVKNTSAKVINSNTVYPGLLSVLRSVFSFSISSSSRIDDIELSEVSVSGKYLVNQSEALRREVINNNKKEMRFNITKKLALCLGWTHRWGICWRRLL